MQVNINPSASIPIAEQIRSQLAGAIAARNLRAGDPLTAPAKLAEQLVTSPAAVLKAYRELESEGLCRRGEGGFEVAPMTLDEQRERARLAHLGGSRQSLLEELELARRVQQQLMPASPIAGDGYRVAARVHAAEFVSGDFFDILPRGGGVVDVVVADVSGKGVGASLVMAFVKARLPMLPAALPVNEILGQLNAQLCGDLGPRQFVALAYARFRAGEGTVEIANAGLPYPHLLRLDRKPVALTAPGPSLPLGVRAEIEYASVQASLEPGDRLLVYSDGVPEMSTAGGGLLGYRELSALLQAYWRETPHLTENDTDSLQVWLDGFLSRVAQVGPVALADDQTALVLERLEA